MDIKTLGIDLAKNIFQLHGVDAAGKVVLRKRLTRGHLLIRPLPVPPLRFLGSNDRRVAPDA